MTTILCQNKEKLEEFYASKVALEKVRPVQEVLLHCMWCGTN